MVTKYEGFSFGVEHQVIRYLTKFQKNSKRLKFQKNCEMKETLVNEWFLIKDILPDTRIIFGYVLRKGCFHFQG